MRRGRSSGIGRIKAVFGLSVGVLLVTAISVYAEEGKRLETKEEPSKTNVSAYGRIELDATISTRNTNPLDPNQFNGYSTAAGKSSASSSTFNPRFSVLGVKADRTGLDRSLSGVVEVDFYGGTDNAGNIPPRLRLANIHYKTGNNEFAVGQDWTPVMGLHPDLVDFSIAGYTGNLWQRIPQITLTHKFNDNISGLVTALRFERGLSGQKIATTGSGASEASFGDPERQPYYGGRLAYTGTGNAEGFLVALSSAYRYYRSGASTANGLAIPSGQSINSYLVGTELAAPLGPVKFTGELAYGSALGAEWFRFGQERNLGTGKAIRTVVGWGQLNYSPVKDYTLLAGAGFDNPVDSDVRSTTALVDQQYKLNERTWLTLIHPLWENFNIALEWNHLMTDWSTGESFHGNNYMVSTWWNF